jgi:hypothetical protein
MKKILFLIFLCSATVNYSQTNISGGLFTNTTWTVTGSPYILSNDVALFPGYSLTIEPGVIIKFNSNSKLILRGTMTCIGTNQSPIVFTSNLPSPTNGSWVGIEIDNSQGGKIIGSYILGQYAENFIKILSPSTGQVLSLNNSQIRNCNYAIHGYDGQANFSVFLDNMFIDQNIYGFVYAHNATITNSIFSNGEKGIHSWEVPSNNNIVNCEFFNFTIWPENIANGLIDNCHFHNNAVGVKLRPNITIINSEIEFNSVGVEADYPLATSGANFHDNNICNNLVYNFKHFYGYPINISDNCWCSDSIAEISETIFDAYDDASLGIVTFSPINTDCASILSIENSQSTANNFQFYPNPTTGLITFNSDSNKRIIVFSIDGEIVFDQLVQKYVNLSNLSAGMYFVKCIENDSFFSVQKLLKL